MASPSLSAQDQRRVELLVSTWKGKFCWKLLSQAIERQLGIKTTRQTLCTYTGIYSKFTKRKAELRGMTNKIIAQITGSDVSAREHIDRLAKEVKALNEIVAEQLRQIERMLANAANIPNVDLGELVEHALKK